MIKQSSLDAYIELKGKGKMQAQQKTILQKMIPNLDYTRRELAALTGIETSTISARVNAMLNTFISVTGKRKCRISGKTVESIAVIVA